MKEDVIGNRYGKLVVLCDLPKAKGKNRVVGCVCDCGNFTKVILINLKSGATKGCGCGRVTHGLSNTREYSTYCGIKDRCLNPKSSEYPKYGERGITVCDRWLDPEKGFLNFKEDMGNIPEGDFTIERLNVNKGYGPDNCTWLHRRYQPNNRRNVYKWDVDGEVMTIKDIARKYPSCCDLKQWWYSKVHKTPGKRIDGDKSRALLEEFFVKNKVDFSKISVLQ